MNTLTPFNLTGFNISESNYEEDLEFSMYCYEKYDTMITFSKNTPLQVICNEKVYTNIQLTMAVPERVNLESSLQVKVNGEVFVVISINTSETIEAKGYLAEDIFDTLNLKTNVNTNGYLACDKEVSFDCLSQLMINEAYLSKDIPQKSVLLHENLITNFNSTTLKNLISKVQGRMWAGDQVIINSDRFTVYKNDVNFLHAYSGDWINLSREVESIEIKSNGKLKGKLITRERFL